MALFKRKNKSSIFYRQQETKLYELVMNEITSNKRQKGIWGQAIVKANGDEKKAEAEYIRLRVESLKDELEIEKQNENEQVIIMEKVKKYSEKESQKLKQKSIHKYKKQVPQEEHGFRIFLIVIGLIIISVIFSELQ